MTREPWPARHRFWIEDPLHVGAPLRLDALAHQLAVVLRLTPGAAIILINGDGNEYLATLSALSPRHAAGEILAARPGAADPHLHLTLFQCTLKQDKFDWVLQKGVELGVSRFVPVVSERSIVRPLAALAGKRARWSAILREATEQCGRTRPPELGAAIDLDAVTLPSGVHGFVAWEEAETAPALAAAVTHALHASGNHPPPLALLVGPEGGLAHNEVQTLMQRGWQAVTLGRRILRAETAALAGVTVIMACSGELGQTPA
ncbi:MAG TPA: 16S rRNA (uracil(1498)-N(3))-methyltransferase [Chloroflexi bacterium]|nr:16S rRNA (uracil(1498)-N(3))-methyltransferase [Chloroflexota bacterium]